MTTKRIKLTLRETQKIHYEVSIG